MSGNSDFFSRAPDYLLAVARGQVPGAYPINGFGRHTSAGAVSNQIIWPDGTFVIPPSAGVQMAIVSTSANDAAAGTGIRQVEVHYLDASLNPQFEIVTLNGLTPVNTVATDIRFVQDVHGHTTGALKLSAGIIAMTNGGNTYGYIPAGTLRSASSARMVPKGKRMFVVDLAAGASSGTAAAAVQIELVATQHDTRLYTNDGLFFPQGMTALQDTTAALRVTVPGPFMENAVVAMRGTTDKAATLAGTWFGWVEDAR